MPIGLWQGILSQRSFWRLKADSKWGYDIHPWSDIYEPQFLCADFIYLCCPLTSHLWHFSRVSMAWRDLILRTCICGIIGILRGYVIRSGRRPEGSQRPMIYQRMAHPRAHDVASQASSSIRCRRAEGPSIYWIIQGLCLTYNCVSQYIRSYFPEMCHKSHWILQRIHRMAVCYRQAFTLSRRCRVSRSRPRVFHETIPV